MPRGLPYNLFGGLLQLLCNRFQVPEFRDNWEVRTRRRCPATVNVLHWCTGVYWGEQEPDTSLKTLRTASPAVLSTRFGQRSYCMKKTVVFTVLVCLLWAGFAFAKTGTLLVAFGTSMESGRPAIDALEKTYREAYGKEPLALAFTSDIIRNKLAKQGQPVLSVNAAMNKLAKEGVTELVIQSLHMLPGEEYQQLERMVVKNLAKYPGVFTSVKVGYPLLLSEKDLDTVVKIVLASLADKRKAGDAVLLMGHGNDRGPGDLTLAATAAAFNKADPLVWLASVEGANSFDAILPKIKAAGVQRVWLQPFMIVAGDHANNDLAGAEEDSWASRLKAAGMTPLPNLVGLGQLDGIQRLFLEHTKNAVVDLANTKKAE